MRTYIAVVLSLFLAASATADKKKAPRFTPEMSAKIVAFAKADRAKRFREKVELLEKMHQPGMFSTEEQAALYEEIVEEVELHGLTWKELGVTPYYLYTIAFGGTVT